MTSFVFPAGEENKTLDTVKALYEHLILEKFDRKDLLIALGGGVVGDLTGFAAGHLFERHRLCTDSDNPVISGGFQYRRKDGS